MQQVSTTNRDTRMDNAKFILILLVILGHCLERLSQQGINGSIYNTIYTFHMPLFIFITGYFTNTKKDIKTYFDGVLNLLLTYILFQFVWFIVNRDFSFQTLIVPAWTLWYLLSAASWKCLIYLFRRKKPTTLFVYSIIAALIGGFVDIDVLSIPRTLTFSPFFVLGYIARANKFNFNKIRSPFLLIPTIIIILMCILFLNGDYTWLLYGKSTYHNFGCPVLLAPFLRLCSLVTGAIISACILAYCPTNPRTAKYGEKTLFFYLYHTFIIFVLQTLIHHFDINKSLPLFIICMVVIVIGLLIADRIKILHTILNPYKMIKGMRN